MIIDTHTHIYDPTRPEGVPWPPKDNELLYRTVLPTDSRRVSSAHGVTGTVIVEASVWVDDNDWVLDIAAADPFVVGVVGWLDLRDKGFAAYLSRFAKNPLFRGIRPRQTAASDWLSGDCLRNLKALADADLSLDLIARPDELATVAGIAEKVPSLRIILDHIAHVRIDGEEPDPVWTDGMTRVVEHPNVFCKASGFVEASAQSPAPTDATYYRPTLDFLWKSFGENRLVFGSNWPVCEMKASYATMFNLLWSYMEEKGESARDKVFRQNARTVYKWLDRSA